MGNRVSTSVIVAGGIYARAKADIPLPEATIGGSYDDDIVVILLPKNAISIHSEEDNPAVLTAQVEGFKIGDKALDPGETVVLKNGLEITHSSEISLTFIQEQDHDATVQTITDDQDAAGSVVTTHAVSEDSLFEDASLPAGDGPLPNYTFFDVALARPQKLQELPQPILILIGIAILGFCVNVIANLMTGSPPEMAQKMQPPPAMQDVATKSEPELPPVHLQQNLASAREFLEQKLRDADLTGIQIHEQKGSLYASGEHLVQARKQWEAVQSLYDISWSETVPLVTQSVTEIDPAPPLRVQSAWLGENKSIRTVYGETFDIGDQTPDGWSVVMIESGFVTLEQNNIKLKVPF